MLKGWKYSQNMFMAQEQHLTVGKKDKTARCMLRMEGTSECFFFIILSHQQPHQKMHQQLAL